MVSGGGGGGGGGGKWSEKKVAFVHIKETPLIEQKFTTERITESHSDKKRQRNTETKRQLE